MIPMDDGKNRWFKLEFKDWCEVGVGAVIVLGSMAAVGFLCDKLKGKDNEKSK